MKKVITPAFLLLSFSLFSQAGFNRIDSVPVFMNSQQLQLPWAGGMNFCQFSDIDLNGDGIKDLFVFDRSGNKITTYINNGTPNQVDYVFAPQYIPKFPRMHDWVLLRDYDCDGRVDIFTSSASCIQVYRNISTGGNLQFQLVTNKIMADLAPNSSHIPGPINVSWVDIPAISDVDGDGDLDVLTYGNGGIQVQWFRNMSKETYGTCDSLIFRIETLCWGNFSEDPNDPTITLNTPCSPPPIMQDSNAIFPHNAHLHSGGCLETINTDGDNDQDLLAGNLGSNYIAYLRNDGTPLAANMGYNDPYFPIYDQPMTMTGFGCAFHVDVNNDGKKDVVFSPNAPNTSNNFYSCQYYRNTGRNDSVRLAFVQDDFLQGQMIDVGEGCYPVLFDYDNDGDLDLLIGNKGYWDSVGIYRTEIALYKNTGSNSAPAFTFITNDFAGIFANALGINGIAPTFGDLDGDGDADMLLGDPNGKLWYFRKDPGPADNFVYVTNYYQNIDIGSFATPQIVDVDGDGLSDLLIGDQTGKVSYYRNTGTAAAPVFTLVTHVLGNFSVNAATSSTGFSAPFLYKQNGQHVLLVGSERGFIFRFDSIDGNLAGTFHLTDSLYVNSYLGGRLGVCVADLNNDSMNDVLVGNYAGGLSLYYGSNNPDDVQEISPESGFFIYPNPAAQEITIQTDLAVPGKQTFTLHDISGKLIRVQTITQQKTSLDISALPAGIYFCTLTDRNGFPENRKLVISR